VQEVGPFVDIAGPGLHLLPPPSIFLYENHTSRRQHTHYLISSNIHRILDDQKINQVLRVRQAFGIKSRRRHFTIDTKRLEMLPGLFHICRVGIQPLDNIAIIYSQFGCELSIAAPNVHDKSALDLRRENNFLA
jgi:hypothetical protein